MKHQVEKYELVIPIYMAHSEETLHANVRLSREYQEQIMDLVHVKSRLVHAVPLVLKSMDTPEVVRQQPRAASIREKEQSVQQKGAKNGNVEVERPAASAITLVDTSPEQNDQNMGAAEDSKPATPSLPRGRSLATSATKSDESSGKRSRPSGNVANDQE
jgi:hypothetical protein